MPGAEHSDSGGGSLRQPFGYFSRLEISNAVLMHSYHMAFFSIPNPSVYQIDEQVKIFEDVSLYNMRVVSVPSLFGQ